MRKIKPSSSFKKDLKRVKRQGKDIEKIKFIIDQLAGGKTLLAINKDHPLQGDLKGARECHIQDDWLLIYEITQNFLYLVRTGSHSELYKR
jgi:mRNA interferase YafQ